MNIIVKVFDLFSQAIDKVFDQRNANLQADLERENIKLSEEQLNYLREKLAQEFKVFLVENVQSVDRDFKNFIVDYEGAGKDIHPSIQFIRGIIRPVVTLWAVAMLTWLLLAEPATVDTVSRSLERIPERLFDIFWIIFGFWFGGRAAQHILEKYTSAKVQETQANAQSALAIEQEKTQQKRIETQTKELENLPFDSFSDMELENAGLKPLSRRQYSSKQRREPA